MMTIKTLSSLDLIFPESCPEEHIIPMTALSGEPFSFQIAYRCEKEFQFQAMNYTIESDLPISLYAVNYIPQLYNRNLPNSPSGLYPDILVPKKTEQQVEDYIFPWYDNHFEAGTEEQLYLSPKWASLWVTVNEDGLPLRAGDYTFKIIFRDTQEQNILGEHTVRLHIVDAQLPEQTLLYTNWFHCDCLSDYYQEEPFTERFWQILKNYFIVAGKHGMNMVLTPCFTPPLDTGIGRQRKTVQLVDIAVTEQGYQFDFFKLRRFIRLAKECKITHFEHAHFYTQWGVEKAPHIVAKVNGKEQEIFGWNVSATDERYAEFLRAYIPALREILREEGVEKNFLFHISDEPSDKHAENYQKALAQVEDLLDGCQIGDALSHYELYQKGLVKLPIVISDRMDDFYGRCEHYWCYYTGGQIQNHLSNRIIGLEPANNRSMGYQLFVYGCEGFLHWGFNYWYDVLSHGICDPKVRPAGYSCGSGTSSCVYPNFDGRAFPSMRMKVFAEGLCDQRALTLLEQKKGREFCMALLKKYFGQKLDMYSSARNAEQMLRFRYELNCALENK